MTACRVCACTEEDCSGCIEKTGAPCWWVSEDLCSACATNADADAYGTLACDVAEEVAERYSLSGVMVLLLDNHGDVHVGSVTLEEPIANALIAISRIVHAELEKKSSSVGGVIVGAPPALIPNDPDKDTLRWIRDTLQNSDESHASDHYTEALELVQRLITARAGNAA
jgi:hypothetical protein